MTKSSSIKKSEVGEIRPSQALTTSGVGALVDLPNISVMVMGLDDWPENHSAEIAEERLLLSVQSVLEHQVERLMTPPRGPETGGTQNQGFDASHQIGMPVAAFPRWMVCSRCRLLAPLQSGLFEAKVYPYRPDKTCYVHPSCHPQGKAPLVLPARFLVTCERGHLDDFRDAAVIVEFQSPKTGGISENRNMVGNMCSFVATDAIASQIHRFCKAEKTGCEKERSMVSGRTDVSPFGKATSRFASPSVEVGIAGLHARLGAQRTDETDSLGDRLFSALQTSANVDL